MAETQGGLLDGLVKIGFDKTKIDIVKVETGVGNITDGIEPAVTSPGNLDAFVFNALKDIAHNFLIDLKHVNNGGGLVVGDVGPVGKKNPLHTEEEINTMIVEAGGDPKKFAGWLLLLQFLPDAISLILKLLGK